jgi:hypothetical protein
MDKTFLEKQIERRAKNRLGEELTRARDFVDSNKILREIVVGEQKIFYKYLPSDDPGYHNMPEETKKALEHRLKELIDEETTLLMQKVNAINYLFENPQE